MEWGPEQLICVIRRAVRLIDLTDQVWYSGDFKDNCDKLIFLWICFNSREYYRVLVVKRFVLFHFQPTY